MATSRRSPKESLCATMHSDYAGEKTGSGLLTITGYHRPSLVPSSSYVLLNIVDETAKLEWTILIGSTIFEGAIEEPIRLRVPRSLASHKVIVKVIHGTSSKMKGSADDDEKFMEVKSVSSCAAQDPLFIGSVKKWSGPYDMSVFDLRPRLRESVGIETSGGMTSIIKPDSILPAKGSHSFNCGRASAMELKILQGNQRTSASCRKVCSLRLAFLSVETTKKLEVSLDIQEDGTLTACARENNNEYNEEKIQAPSIIDVIGPAIAVDEKDPDLTVEWTQTFGIRRHIALLRISTTYQMSQIHRWRISIPGTMFKSGNVFYVPVQGFVQTFQIPIEVLVSGVLSVTVEGLQKMNDKTESGSVFKIVCRKSTTFQSENYEVEVEPYNPLSRRLEKLRVSEERTDSTSRLLERQRRLASRKIEVTDMKIRIERSTFHQATVVISSDLAVTSSSNIQWKIAVSKTATATGRVFYEQTKEFVAKATEPDQRFDFPIGFHPGHSFQVTVRAEGCSVEKQTANFRAELTIDDIKRLHKIALRQAGYGSSRCTWLYRNKSVSYFDDIMKNHRGIMKVYDKDNSGDPASPINLQIKGLFFMASVEQDGDLPSNSPFGPLRICILVNEMFKMASNLYFVDYYCMRGQLHYVTLVMTRPGSATDRFCADRLLSLDIDDRVNNPFLFRNSGYYHVSAGYRLRVELLFTEDVDIRPYQLERTFTVGKGSSTPGGIPKNPTCLVCNLPRNTQFVNF